MQIHHTSEVDSCKKKEKNTIIWRWTQISRGVWIGNDCMIGNCCYIGPNVRIGNNVRIQNGCFIPEGVEIGDNTFLGPHVVFTNDKYPPSGKLYLTRVGKWVSIGANSTILPVLIGDNVRIGAGSVVTKDLTTNVYFGNPARPKDEVCD